jgi:hypothetical protein
VPPHAKIPYEIKPLESVTTKAGVSELCESLGNGQLNQRAAQAAAWHLNNNMSWEQLAAKRLRFADGTSRPYFTQAEIQAAMQIANQAVQVAAEKTKTTPSSSSSSSSSNRSSSSGS